MRPDKRTGPPDGKRLLPGATARNVLFVMIGVAGLLLKGRYSGPGQDLVHSYGGNVTVSFAVYFWARLAVGTVLAADRARGEQGLGPMLPRLLAAGLALVVVQLFELLDGFGVMTNVYDRFDLLANTAGLAIAFALDALLARGRREASPDRNNANPRQQRLGG